MLRHTVSAKNDFPEQCWADTLFMAAKIADNGRVLNVSGGTAVMKDAEGYRGIDRKWAQGWGQGLALALLAAVIENENEGR